jgi:protein gp37
MSTWNPWKGCHRKSEGCKHCYIFRANDRKKIDTNIIYKTDEFAKPLQKDKKGDYKIKSGQMVYLCFNADFLVEEAEEWRNEIWEMIRIRNDLTFMFLTKRIERFNIGLPEDFKDNFDNLVVCCTIENQKRADERLPIFRTLPIKHKMITIQPMLEKINISKYIDDAIEYVVVGGESGKDVRPLNYDWVLDIRQQCMDANVSFEFRQLGSIFIKDKKTYNVQKQYLCAQARKAGINYKKS